MDGPQIGHWLGDHVTTAVWIILAIVTVVLLVLMRTRWGKSHPLRRYAALSIWAHMLMAMYATMVPIVVGGGTVIDEPVIRISTVDQAVADPDREAATQAPRPWDQFPLTADTQPDVAVLTRADFDSPQDALRAPTNRDEPLPGEIVRAAPAINDPDEPEANIPGAEANAERGESAFAAATIEAPAAERRAPAPESLPQVQRPDRQQITESHPDVTRPQSTTQSNLIADFPSPTPRLQELPSTNAPAASIADLVDVQARPADSATAIASSSVLNPLAPHRLGPDTVAGDTAGTSDNPHQPPLGHGNPAVGTAPPPIYRLRTAPNRTQVAQRHGGSPESEAAVEAALRWLAAHQSAHGRWHPAALEGGRERTVGGRDRNGTGAHADTGVTGLAILAFLGAGHTHLEGDYQEHVRRGLEFLLKSQGADGNLAGPADTFAAMYCHGMATLALCEAYGMSRDHRLDPTIRRAVAYTVKAQHASTGGWRYRPGDLGDTSQHGWQVMALRSAQLAGIPLPDETRDGAVRFLKSVSSGDDGGLASYRPGEAVSRTMTAEAMFCRQLLGMRHDNPAGAEAAAYLMGQLPGEGQANLYYWYYGTLALYQHHGEPWRHWNQALQETLVASQIKNGSDAGSWPPDSVWSGYGGRAYSTAMGALCLEVYYRFLPLYVEAAAGGRITK